MNSEILLVEDDRDIRLAMAEALEMGGFTVSSAVHGEEAIRYLRGAHRPPRLVLLDLRMPVMDGRAFLDEIRKTPAWDGLPVVLLSADSRLSEQDLAPRVAGIVRKPVRLQDLLDLAARWCGKVS